MTAADRYNPERFRIPFSAEVAKSVDAVDSKSTVEIRAGSSPAFGTIGTSIDVNGRLFLCLKSSIRKAFLAFSLGRGTWFCNQCGAGDGLKLVEKVFGISASEAAGKVNAVTGNLPPVAPEVTAVSSTGRNRRENACG